MVFTLLEGKRGLHGQKPDSQSAGQGIEESSTGKIDLGILSADCKRSRKSDRILGTDFCTCPALNTFRKTGSPRIFGDRSHGTGFLAFQALVTLLADPALEKPERRDEA